MAKRRKRRTSIKTAAGTTQEQFLARMRALRDDPLRVLPATDGDEPKAIQKIRAGLERVAKGKPGFRDRRDKGIVGAVVQSVALADLTAAPRLADHKVAGRRRFYLMRGQVARAAMVGVQNHDDPTTLLFAYRDLAKREGLHVFAADRVWCHERPDPPAAWIDALAKAMDVDLGQDNAGWSCPHPERARVALSFPDGPRVAVCGPCGGRKGGFHGRMANRYAGASERKPFDVSVQLPDGQVDEPDREDLAAYRGGIQSDEALIRTALAAWRARARGESTAHFVLDERDFGGDQEAFLDALDASGAERTALAAMTVNGYAHAGATVAEVFDHLAQRMAVGVGALLHEGAGGFTKAHGDLPPRRLIAAAADEQARRDRVARLPGVSGLGVGGRWLDGLARIHAGDGSAAAAKHIEQALASAPVGPGHLFGFLLAMRKEAAIRFRFDADAQEHGVGVKDLAAKVLASEGEDYVQALRGYLQNSGLGSDA